MKYIIKEKHTGYYFKSINGDHFTEFAVYDTLDEATRLVGVPRLHAVAYCRKISRILKETKPNAEYKIVLVGLVE